MAPDDGAPNSELAFAAGVSRFSASRHLQVMREAGLVSQAKAGNRVLAKLVLDPFRQIDDWLWSIVNPAEDSA